MAEAWKEAKKFVNSLVGYSEVVAGVKLRERDFRLGDFRVDEYFHKQLGMDIERVLDKTMYDKILSFAEKRNLEVERFGNSVILSDSKYNIVARICSLFFTTLTPDLFEAIGKEIYDLKI